MHILSEFNFKSKKKKKDQNMIKIFCRKVNVDEIGGVLKLYHEAENMEEMNRIRFQKIESHAKKIYQQMLNKGSYTYGCFITEKIADLSFTTLVGVINVNKILDYYPGYENDPYVHLETFIVSKLHQNKGIGTYLLQETVKQIKQEGCTYIILQSDNEYVQKIAQKIGLSSSLKDMRYDFVKQ